MLIYSHHEGEVWGLCELEGENAFVTSGDDNKLVKWSIEHRQAMSISKVGAVAPADEKAKAKPKKKMRGGASTLSSFEPQYQSRAVAYEKNAKHLAVA